jgi:2-keto-4-pentenoate hydratase/2-oxohepta-3-ene-1,7-dioic acid hydratase in catechol pathway
LLRGLPEASFVDMLTFLDGEAAARDVAQELVESTLAEACGDAIFPLGDARLLAPVPRPRSIRDCLAFEQHYIGAMRTVAKCKFGPLASLDRAAARVLGRGFLRPPRVWYERPIYYKGNPASVVGPESDVEWPSFTEQLDFELELAAVIGRPGKNIAAAQARDWIAGFTIFNDFSARDFQMYEMAGRLGPAKSKDFDTGNVLGPWLVTADEIGDPYKLQMRARVNGEEWSCGSSGQMRFTFEEMIAAISQDETLHPGDVIGSGTLPGGCGLELDRWLSPGDVVELEIERIGVLRNRVVRRERLEVRR